MREKTLEKGYRQPYTEGFRLSKTRGKSDSMFSDREVFDSLFFGFQFSLKCNILFRGWIGIRGRRLLIYDFQCNFLTMEL